LPDSCGKVPKDLLAAPPAVLTPVWGNALREGVSKPTFSISETVTRPLSALPLHRYQTAPVR